mmetsp:Transcript_8072/g.25507  ORF Transcript_8072/g.25507 Transcript_8072/m.25507 type:complete len:213 (+) Transcript_8072:211-849(+)
MKSSRFMHVTTRVESARGTGKRCLRMVHARLPSGVEKFSKMRCGNTSGMLTVPSMSCRRIVLERLKYAVGPCGMCATTSPSGTPRVSCTMSKSVKPSAFVTSTSSLMLVPPRFMRWQFGKTSRSSLRNCVSLDEGSCEVVIRRRGSATPALAYSSSSTLDTCSSGSSSCRLCLSARPSLRSSVGSGLSLASASLSWRLRARSACSLASRLLR